MSLYDSILGILEVGEISRPPVDGFKPWRVCATFPDGSKEVRRLEDPAHQNFWVEWYLERGCTLEKG